MNLLDQYLEHFSCSFWAAHLHGKHGQFNVDNYYTDQELWHIIYICLVAHVAYKYTYLSFFKMWIVYLFITETNYTKKPNKGWKKFGYYPSFTNPWNIQQDWTCLLGLNCLCQKLSTLSCLKFTALTSLTGQIVISIFNHN